MAKTRQLGLLNGFQLYNLTIDRTLTTRHYGRNGILYEWELPYGANPSRYWEEAVNVKSIKGDNSRPSTAKGREGYVYRTGMYQPIGHKREFTYFQLKKMGKKARQAIAILEII